MDEDMWLKKTQNVHILRSIYNVLRFIDFLANIGRSKCGRTLLPIVEWISVAVLSDEDLAVTCSREKSENCFYCAYAYIADIRIDKLPSATGQISGRAKSIPIILQAPRAISTTTFR